MSTATVDSPVALQLPTDRRKSPSLRRARLRDGREVLVRRIRQADTDLLRDFDAGLSEASRRMRYLGWMSPMSSERAAAMTTTDSRKRFALVAISGEGENQVIVADCRIFPITESDHGVGVAIAVADAFHEVGLGKTLIELILAVAADRGLTEVVADVRYDNTRMMRLLKAFGFEITSWELGVVTFVVHLEQGPVDEQLRRPWRPPGRSTAPHA